MRPAFIRILSLVFALLLLPTAAFAEDSSEDSDGDSAEYEASETAEQTDEQPSDDDSAPVYVVDYFAGTALDLSQFAGKAVFLNFFTEWCPYCMEEMPDIKRIYDLYDPESLAIVLVHPWDGENADNTASVVAKYGLEGINTVEDTDMAISQIVGMPGYYPTSVFIDKNGYLYYAVASKLEFDLMAQLMDEMGVPLRNGTTRPSSAPSGSSTVVSVPSGSSPAVSVPSGTTTDATTSATPKN
jgi:thiol-disulfide isomerase/thioredoxin